MNVDTLIIPDIHHKTAIVDGILARHPEIERRVFLGDVYDDFGDSPEIMRHTALWHKEMLSDDRNTFLLGNHDVTYMSGGFLKCGGYSLAKQYAFNDVLRGPHYWHSSRLSIGVNGWLLSHAGYHPSLHQAHPGNRKTREDAALRFVAAHRYQDCPALLEAGRARGGVNEVGGLTWLDWKGEFVPIPGLRQIVGHTAGAVPRSNGENVCLDCHLAWYGIVRSNGTLELHETNGDMIFDATGLGEGSTTLADVFQDWNQE